MAVNNKNSKLDRNREKVKQDRLQVLLTKMLQDEDNKYCVDCDAKGPRWASWNLGVFLCIRCAGIHRNLGVHISKVKSVNLDSWTPLQVSSMQVMGNSRGRAVYEARVPEDFRRPQSDQQMDTFIRTKYEKKKYVALEWKPTKPPDLPQGWAEIIEAEKQKKDIRSIVLPSRALKASDHAKSTSSTTSSVPENSKSEIVNGSPGNGGTIKAQIPPPAQPSSAFDLLGLNSVNNSSSPNNFDATSIGQKLPQVSSSNGSTKLSSQLDLLFIGGELTKTTNDNDFDDFVGATSKSNNSNSNGSNNNGQFASQSSNSNGLDQLTSGFGPGNHSVSEKNNAGTMSKDSIMALFNKPPSAPETVHHPVPIIGMGVTGQASFTGYPPNIQAHGSSYGMNATSGVGMAGGMPTIPNIAVPVGSGIGQPQAPMPNHFGVQQQPGAMSNNPFLSNFGAAVNTASTSNSNQAGWGFMN